MDGCSLTTSLTIYSFGLRGNSATRSIGKHRFRTRKPRKAPEIKKKTIILRFGTKMSQVRILSFRPKKHREVLFCVEMIGREPRLQEAHAIIGNVQCESLPYHTMAKFGYFGFHSTKNEGIKEKVIPSFLFLYVNYQPNTNQRYRYAGTIAANVNGIPILKKSEFLTVYPSLRSIPIPAIFADAPIGVQFPPSVAPESKPK